MGGRAAHRYTSRTHTERHGYTDTQAHRHIDTERHRETQSHTDRHTYRQKRCGGNSHERQVAIEQQILRALSAALHGGHELWREGEGGER